MLALPLMILGSGALAFRFKTSTVPNTPLGKVSKYVGLNLFLWMTGKLMFRKRCEEIIINSNVNTPFSNKIRERRGFVAREPTTSDDVYNIETQPMSRQFNRQLTNAYGDPIDVGQTESRPHDNDGHGEDNSFDKNRGSKSSYGSTSF